MKQAPLILVLCVLMCTALPQNAQAKMPPDCDHRFFVVHFENVYSPLIELHDGRECVTTPVFLSNDPAAAYLIAISAPAAEIDVQCLAQMPEFRGRTPVSKLHEKLDVALMGVRCTQFYPILFDIVFAPAVAWTAPVTSAAENPPPSPLTVRKIASRHAGELQNALTDFGLTLPAATVAQLQAKDQTILLFVRRWKVTEHEYCQTFAQITFPATQIISPPCITATESPAQSTDQICIIGHVTPRETLPPKAEVHYFYGTLMGDPQIQAGGMTTYGIWKENTPYTRILGVDPSRALTFVPQSGFLNSMTDKSFSFLTSALHESMLALVVLAVLSYLAGGFTGLIIAGRWRGYAKLGLWNLLTITGLWVRAATLAARGRLPFPQGPRRFVWVYSLTFVLLTFVISGFLHLILGPYSGNW